ncbi:aminotransferase class I/II-fold pyridoxal phosphate-dependent enzyme [Mucilaginibacter sp.]|uniref:aminotransferase class I/II-fold pyridoxal phosphate-dependent enzyme n=1 Tax=Mucilaginibacter sp. TaxID=1882438 RepID=UPI003D11C3BE
MPRSFLEKKLTERLAAGTYRTLKTESPLIDFCSNDYLGFAKSVVLKDKITNELSNAEQVSNGATGSRLISGNSEYAEELEKHIAALHASEAGLIFNSGYTANLGLFSAILQRGDTVITDELIHASIIDGVRLSHATRFTFSHNDLASLEDKLQRAKGNVYVAIESVYSMDGDSPPILNILELTEKYNAHLIVDEAHAVGLYGFGLTDTSLNSRIFAKIVTFGKALGSHGAIVLGNNMLREYLINFSRPFIYTTALPFHQLAAIWMAYELLVSASAEIELLKNNIYLFKQHINSSSLKLIPSDSAIQCIVFDGREKTKSIASQLQQTGFDVRAILSPTVAEGSERIRICLHSFNTDAQIIALTDALNKLG